MLGGDIVWENSILQFLYVFVFCSACPSSVHNSKSMKSEHLNRYLLNFIERFLGHVTAFGIIIYVFKIPVKNT